MEKRMLMGLAALGIAAAVLAIATISGIVSASIAQDPDSLRFVSCDNYEVRIASQVDWPQWQNDPTHNAVHESASPVISPVLQWSYDAGGSGHAIDVTPLIVGDMVYVLDASGEVQAIERHTGRLVWMNTTDEESAFQQCVPAYGDGRLFVATSAGYLYAFDPGDGQRLWKVKAAGEDRNFECPLTYYDHRLYIGEGLSGGVATKYYYCFSDRGELLWQYAVGSTAGFLWCGALVVGEHVVFPVMEGKLISVDRITGRLTAEANLTDPNQVSFARPDLGMIRASVTWHNGSIYVTSERGQSTGYIFKVGFKEGRFLDEGWSTAIGFSTSTPVALDGKVYVGNGEHGASSGNMTCLDETDGRVVWSFPVDSGVKSSPSVFAEDGRVFIYFTVQSGANGSGYCVDENGSMVWKINPEGDNAYILQGISLSSDSVLFGTDAGKLYCLVDREDG